MQDSTHTRPADFATGFFLLLLTLIGWASSPLFIKYFVDYIDPWTSNGVRYSTAAVFWLPVLLLNRRSAPASLWKASFWPAFFNITGQILFAWVLYLKVDPGLMTFLLRVQIVAVTVGAFLLFPDERKLIRSGGYWIGILLVLCGTAGTIFGGHDGALQAGFWGVLCGLGSGVLFGGYAVAVRRCVSGYSPMAAFSVISIYTSAAMLVLMLFFGRQHGAVVLSLTAGQWGCLVLSALIGIALGHVFYYASIARLGVALAAGVMLLQPFMTSGMSALIFKEHLTALQWLAGCMSVIGAGCVIYTQNSIRRAARKAIATEERSRARAESDAVTAGIDSDDVMEVVSAE